MMALYRKTPDIYLCQQGNCDGGSKIKYMLSSAAKEGHKSKGKTYICLRWPYEEGLKEWGDEYHNGQRKI